MTLVETSVFTVICGRDYPGAKNDILAVTAYSLTDCARACASYNKNSGSKECKGAAFKNDLTYNVPVNYGNCCEYICYVVCSIRCWDRMDAGRLRQKNFQYHRVRDVDIY